MDFKKATDGLFNRVDHADLAKALGVSIASIRQARLSPFAKAHRQAPPNWEDRIIRLAEKRVFHYRNLIAELRASKNNNGG
jgi:hypothetical protein